MAGIGALPLNGRGVRGPKVAPRKLKGPARSEMQSTVFPGTSNKLLKAPFLGQMFSYFVIISLAWPPVCPFVEKLKTD